MPRLVCGCEGHWLTEISVPVSVNTVIDEPCPCCGAPPGRRCDGALAGFTPAPRAHPAERIAWAYSCPVRVVQERLL